MKNYQILVLLFAICVSAAGLRAQEAEDEFVIDEIVFSQYDEYTSAISSLSKGKVLTSPVEFEIEGYRFTFSKDTENNEGGILLDYTGRLVVSKGSLVKVERFDGNAMRKIFVVVAITASGADLPSYPLISSFKAKVDGVTVTNWKDFDSTSILMKALPSNNNKGTSYYVTGMNITRDAGVVAAPFGMELQIDDAVAVGSRTAVVYFTLSVANDNGVSDFTITATDEDGMERGRTTFTRYENEVATVNDDGVSDDGGNYTINGRMRLTELKKNERQNLTFAVAANYENGESVPGASAPVYEVNTTGATAIDDIRMECCDDVSEYYNLQGVKVAEPRSGIYIVKRGTTYTKTRIL